MTFETHIPSFPLNHFISAIIYHEGYNPSHNINRFLPDGNTELLIDLTNHPKYIYDNVTLQEKQACKKSWVSGVRTEFISIPAGKQTRMIVVSFKKGKANVFYKMPLQEIKDTVVDADIVFGNAIHSIREQLLNVPSCSYIFPILEKWLLSVAGSGLNPGINSKCIDFAVESIVSHPGMLQLKTLSDKIGYSQKHFISLFTRQVGVSPKAYMRIIRFQKAIQQINRHQKINWSRFALDSGYYDQAHYINDFKSFSGFTPNEYVQLKSEYLNYVPVS